MKPLVRINSQSGKGGVAFVMDHCFGYKMPKANATRICRCNTKNFRS